MLTRLMLRHVGLIAKSDISFSPGFTTLTGETGAGKSMLIGGLSLCLGARADKDLIRHGESQAVIEAVFDVSSRSENFQKTLKNEGFIDDSDSEIICRRVITKEKSRAFINGRQVPLRQLADISEKLVDIHGQYESRYLINPRKHAEILDRFVGEKMCQQADEAFAAWCDARKVVDDLKKTFENQGYEQELLRSFVDELDRLSPEKGEEETLAKTRQELMLSDKLIQSIQEVGSILFPEEGGVVSSLARAESIFTGFSHLEKVSPLCERLQNLSAEISDFNSDFNNLKIDITVDPERLSVVDERLFALRECARKHRCHVDDLAEKRDELASKLADFDTIDIRLAEQEALEAEKRGQFRNEKELLTAARKKVVPLLKKKIEKALHDLEMPHTEFDVSFTHLTLDEWQRGGCNELQFMVATNVGSPLKPLEKVASGGEVSRLMLALKQVLYAHMSPTTLIFDEVDTGVSGSVAEAMALAMSDLAKTHQVMAITHLPQVAARGAAHLKIRKEVADGATVTLIEDVKGDKRFDEVARMIAGKEMTDEARAAAKRLLVG